MVKASVTDIKPGTYVGAAPYLRLMAACGAIEVHIFPQSRCAAWVRPSPWDLQPQATLTNANVEQMVTRTDGHAHREVQDGEKKLVVTPRKLSWSPMRRATRRT